MSENESFTVAEQLKSSPIFLRMARNLEQFQDLYKSEQNESKRELMKQRMEEVFLESLKERHEDEAVNATKDEYLNILSTALVDCQSNTFDINRFAQTLEASPIGEKLFGGLHRQSGTVFDDEKSRSELVNEMILCNFMKGTDYVSINIPPAPIPDVNTMIAKIIEGLQAVAKQMQDGPLQETKKVVMTSWLFGGGFLDKAKIIFGDNIQLKDYNNPQGSREIHQLAMIYNRTALKNYLVDGEKPEIKVLTLGRDEFIKRFG